MLPSASRTVYIVPREFVEVRDLQSIVDSLSPLINDPETARTARGRLHLTFDGYGGDARGLWEIPDVRTFAAQLEKAFPYWFFFADLTTDTLQTLALCVSARERIDSGGTSLDEASFQDFFGREVAALNRLWTTASLPPGERQQAIDLVTKYFDSRSR